MRDPAIVFKQTGFTVHATACGSDWRGEILNDAGEVHDGFSYIREGFPGAVVGALRVADIAFAPQLAARMWVYTDDAE